MEQITEESDGFGLAESRARTKKALETIKESFDPGFSSGQHRNKAAEHGRRAEGLISGDAKDSHLTAERAHNRAADLIDQADTATKKAEALD